MGSTARGLRFPEPTDRLNQVAQFIEDLAEDVDGKIAGVLVELVLAANQDNLAQSAFVDMVWTELVDSAGAVAGGVFTAPVAGVYTFTGQVCFRVGVNSGVRQIRLATAAGVAIAGSTRDNGPSVTYAPAYQHSMTMAAGDTAKLQGLSGDTPAANNGFLALGTFLRIERAMGL